MEIDPVAVDEALTSMSFGRPASGTYRMSLLYREPFCYEETMPWRARKVS